MSENIEAQLLVNVLTQQRDANANAAASALARVAHLEQSLAASQYDRKGLLQTIEDLTQTIDSLKGAARQESDHAPRSRG